MKGMIMNRQFLAVLVVAMLAIAGGTALGASPGTIVLAEDPTFLGPGADFPGMWEYVYDVHGDASPVDKVTLSGLDANEIENQWDWSGPSRTGSLRQKWDWRIGHNAYFDERGAYGSYAVNGVGPWILPGEEWSMDNTWHEPNDYSAAYPFGSTTYPFPKFTWAGEIADDGQSLEFISAAQNQVVEGLLLTFRIVHPYAPGNIQWTLLSLRREGQSDGTILGPKFAPFILRPGDVNEDGDINGDDIDLMGEYIRTGIPPTLGNYDLNGDGNVDLLDQDYLVLFLVETSAVDGVGDMIFGTQYGDFNLDGRIELGDLTRLGTYYGVGDKWSEGNANPHLDTDIELGDLTILGTYYGVSNGGVDAIPEPITLSVMGWGAIGLLGRRRSKARRRGSN